MDIETLKEQITTILAATKPYIQKLVDEKVIPAIKTFAYKTLSKKADKVVNSLVKLKEKAEAEEDEDKKAAHLLGFQLGAEAIIAIGNKLVEAGNTLLETDEEDEE